MEPYSRGTVLTDHGRVIRDDADQVLGEWAEELRRAPWPDAAPGGVPPRAVARTAWNAGFSRHSPPQAGGGTGSHLPGRRGCESVHPG